MLKVLIISCIFLLNLNASYIQIDKENIFTVSLKNKNFDDLYIKLKDEINFRSFVIIKELNLAHASNNVAKALKKQEVLSNGKNILMCKASFVLKMLEDNIENITYCPLSISIYEKNSNIFISHRKYPKLNKESKIAQQINKQLKQIILKTINP